MEKENKWNMKTWCRKEEHSKIWYINQLWNNIIKKTEKQKD